jgi:Fe2+ transport system protein FeoA
MTLKDIKAGQTAIISQLISDKASRAKLLDLGLLPGTQLTLKRSLSWSKAVQIYVRQSNLIIRESLAEQVKVNLI